VTTVTWWLRSRGRYGLARLAAKAPVADSHSLSSFAILLAIFLKPIDVPEIRLNRTPFRESRGNLQTSISHCTWLSVAASPCAHSSRKRSRCSYWHLLASRTWSSNSNKCLFLCKRRCDLIYISIDSVLPKITPLIERYLLLEEFTAVFFWYLSNLRHYFIRVSTTGSLHTPCEA